MRNLIQQQSNIFLMDFYIKFEIFFLKSISLISKTQKYIIIVIIFKHKKFKTKCQFNFIELIKFI
jgi:hypothetical protein